MAPQDKPAGDARSAFEALGQDARRTTRMLRDGEPITKDDIERVRARAIQYCCERRRRDKKHDYPQFARELGQITDGNGRRKKASVPVISQILKGTYNGTYEPYIRRIDEFLSREKLRSGQLATNEYVEIDLARRVQGVVHAAKRYGSIAAVIMEPGQGKSTIAAACARMDSAARLITIGKNEGADYGVIDSIFRAMEIPGGGRSRAKRNAIRERLRNDRTAIFLVDEAQRLTASGLEMIRDLRDNSDGDRTIPFVLFGDHKFYRLVKQGRDGRGPVEPQLTRRIFPIFDSNDPEAFADRPKGREFQLYSEQDLVRILNNEKLRVATDEAISYLAALANLKRYGALGTAMNACQIAYDTCRHECVDVRDVQRALRTMLAAKDANLVISQIESTLPATPNKAAVA